MVHYLAATDTQLPLTLKGDTGLELYLGEESPWLGAIYKLLLAVVGLCFSTTSFY